MGLMQKVMRLEPDPPGEVGDPAHGTITVAPGQPYVVVAPGLGRLEMDVPRRTVRVGEAVGKLRRSKVVAARSADNARVAIGGHDIHLRHRSRKSAHVRLDGEVVAELRRVEQMRADMDRFRERYEIAWLRTVEPGVVLVTHALASRFGVGAPGTLLRSLDLWA